MKLSTRVRYAVRAVIDLGLNSQKDLVLLKDIAKRQAVSVKYLENIFASLRRAEIVRGVRGARGGYTLAREAKDITIYDVVMAMQGFVSPIGCVEDSCSCQRSKNCVAQEVWIEVTDAIAAVLKKYNLSELITRHHRMAKIEVLEEFPES